VRWSSISTTTTATARRLPRATASRSFRRHAFPAYPGTGGPTEQRFDARNSGRSSTCPYRRTLRYRSIRRDLAASAAGRGGARAPDLIVVSAGYDFAAGDPVGDLGVDAAVAATARSAT
jgi:acetoin utilization deacetylase AcuC-like enzyme